jgi:3-isopropylmalate dehydratase small subunit
MEIFTTLTSNAAVLADADIDTDIIFPARFLLITSKAGLGRYAFHDRRYDGDQARADFPLNHEPARSAQILIAGDNFGCGSSREQAVWALRDFGFRCVISSSFGEIFYGNCLKNGVLPVILKEPKLAALSAAADAGAVVTVDLVGRLVSWAGAPAAPFDIDDSSRQALLNGWDEILTLLNTRAAAIDAFEAGWRAKSPWLFTAG